MNVVILESKDCDGDVMYWEVEQIFFDQVKELYQALFDRNICKLSSLPEDVLTRELFDGKELLLELI